MTSDAHDLLADLVAGCRAAVREEIDAVRADLERRGLAGPVEARDGVRAPGSTGGLYDWALPPGRYDVRVDDAVTIETESAGGLGVVVRFDARENTLRVTTDAPFGRHPGPAQLTFDPTWLLEALDDRLDRLADDPAHYHPDTALRLFGFAYGHPGTAELPTDAATDLNESQRIALGRVLGSQVQFVWGPPGTGKTRTLGHVGATLAEQGSVLVVATTNTAVDEAARRVADVLGRDAIVANRIIRFGAGSVAGADETLGVDAAVTRAEAIRPSALTRGLEELRDRLGLRHRNDESVAAAVARAQAAARRAGDPAIEALAARLGPAYLAAVRRALEAADVVLSTFARLAVRDELAQLRFESVLIDEASAAPLPYVLFAASLARHRAAAFGDFRQLPAVVVSRGPAADRWLRRDVFSAAGVLSGEDGLPSTRDVLCSMLEEQYRMSPGVRSLVGDLFYGGRLRDARPPEGPPAAAELVMLDTAGLSPVVARPEGSRLNEAHIEAVLQLLETLGRLGEADVAVVSPYRLQARELRRRVRTRLGRLAPADLEIATIHRFQGREKRIVVVDTVDAPPARSWFLDERRNRDFPRLLNVALSRCQDRLILVGTRDGLRQTLPPDALLNRVVDRVCRDGLVVDAQSPARLGEALLSAGSGAAPAAPVVDRAP